MTNENFKNKMQNSALAGGLICFVGGAAVACLYLNQTALFFFWMTVFAAVPFAVLSLPRRKSLAACGLVALSLWFAGGRAFARYHSTAPSPDARYKLVVYATPMLAAFPGQSGDAPGYVQLQKASGEVLGENYVEMIQIVNEAEWNEHEVRIGRGDGGFEWSLP